MEQPHVPRRLAAILAADIAGYTRLTGTDEEGTLARLRTLRRELIDPAITAHRGRIVKTMGDGLLVEFASVVDAVRCAIEMQHGMAARNADLAPERRIVFRVGINLGDVVVEGDDLLGDGVNVASRLEGIAEPGGICLSVDAYRQVQGKVAAEFVDLGEQSLKNVARPVRVYRLKAPDAGPEPALALPDKPSIAVLPFQNMSGDPEQDYFCDGMVEDITTGLSHVKWLFVIARNSSFTYKGRAVDVRTVGRELGVRYVLEGSVRKAGNRVRITVQLIEAATGSHLWAERYDGALEDVFDLQDGITEGVVGAIEPSVRQAEIERARRKRPESLDAYDFYLRALPHAWANSYEEAGKAISLLEEALRLDPFYAAAHGIAAWCHCQRLRRDRAECAHAIDHARKVVASGTDNAIALAYAGFALADAGADFEGSLAAVSRAVEINPNSATVLARGALVNALAGRNDTAMAQARLAIRLSPLDPQRYSSEEALALAFFNGGQFAEAAEAAERVIKYNPGFELGHATLAASYAALGRLDEARQIATRVLAMEPGFRISRLPPGWQRLPVRAALSQAGLPE